MEFEITLKCWEMNERLGDESILVHLSLQIWDVAV